MNIEKYLPIGSIVTIGGRKDNIMIIGYLPYCEDNPNQVVSGEYLGIPLIEGYKEDNKIIFNRETIDNVIFMGYKSKDAIMKLRIMDEARKIIMNSTDENVFLRDVYARALNVGTNSLSSYVIKSKIDEK